MPASSRAPSTARWPFFRDHGLACEIICVNDGSRDDSSQVLKRKAAEHQEVRVVNLLRNYGQHNANLCGLRQAGGDWIVTMDDDLQNPSEEIIHLLTEAAAGSRDVVYGVFDETRAARNRRLGSQLISMINRRVFGQPRDLTVTNYVRSRIASTPARSAQCAQQKMRPLASTP